MRKSVNSKKPKPHQAKSQSAKASAATAEAQPVAAPSKPVSHPTVPAQPSFIPAAVAPLLKPVAPDQPATTPAVPPLAVRRHIEHDMLLAALPHPILVLGEDDRVLYANAAAENFLATSQAMLKRHTLSQILHFGSPLVSLVEQVRRSGATVNEYGVDIALARSEQNKLVDVYGGMLPEQPGLVVLMLQQRSMAQMIERQFTHRQAARSVSGMASVLAHEIKNPLSGIRGAAQLLEPVLSDEDRSLAQLICAETERIRKLVDRMEVFGDERPLEKTPVNIHSVLDHVKRLATSGFAANIRIVEEYDPSLPVIPANRDKLVQATLNLIKNAAEALEGTGDNGRIILRTAFRPGVRLAVPGATTRISLPFMIEIEDNGSGIRDEIKQHLFDPFVTTKPSGTGLGLALVAKIIGDHGGIIECDSVPKRTVFRVLLPIEDARPRLPDRVVPARSPTSPRT
jgi:two-component system nitrogen regulation sensor histidine kinase GlnL